MGGTGTPLQLDAILNFLHMCRTHLYSVKSAIVVYLLYLSSFAALSGQSVKRVHHAVLIRAIR